MKTTESKYTISHTLPCMEFIGIYAYIDPPGTTPTDRQSYGSAISRVWDI